MNLPKEKNLKLHITVRTFSYEFAVIVHHSNFFSNFKISRFILGKIVDLQVFSKLCQLFFS